MTKTAQDIFNEKVSLIYEYNKNSPLFVHAASIEISNNNLDKCIEIIAEGLQKYPQYASAYFILGKAQILIGEYQAADESFAIGSELIGSNKTYEFYKKEIEVVKKQRAIFDGKKRMSFLNQVEIDFPKEESELKKNDISNENFEDKLSEIAEEISSTKISENKSSVNEEFSIKQENKIIPSETLAKIYTNQNQYQEAISVYEELLKLQPEREAYFLSKIAILNTKLG